MPISQAWIFSTLSMFRLSSEAFTMAAKSWIQLGGPGCTQKLYVHPVCCCEREREQVCVRYLIELHSVDCTERNVLYMSMNYWSLASYVCFYSSLIPLFWATKREICDMLMKENAEKFSKCQFSRSPQACVNVHFGNETQIETENSVQGMEGWGHWQRVNANGNRVGE